MDHFREGKFSLPRMESFGFFHLVFHLSDFKQRTLVQRISPYPLRLVFWAVNSELAHVVNLPDQSQKKTT